MEPRIEMDEVELNVGISPSSDERTLDLPGWLLAKGGKGRGQGLGAGGARG